MKTRILVMVWVIIGLMPSVACGVNKGPGSMTGETVVPLDTSTAIADGKVAGLKLGDGLDTCLALWGEPEEQQGGGTSPFLVYRYLKNGLQVTFSNPSKIVLSVGVLFVADPVLPDVGRFEAMVLSSPLSLAPFKSYRREQWDRLEHYDFPAWNVWALQSPDGRKVHYVELTAKEYGVPNTVAGLVSPSDVSGSSREIPITVEDAPTPAIPYSTVFVPHDNDWEQGVVITFSMWQEGARLRMAYQSGQGRSKIGFASSVDGKVWTRESISPMTAPAGGEYLGGPTYIPGRNKLLTNVLKTGGSLGIFAWDLGTGGTPISRGYVIRPSDIRPDNNSNDPGSVVAVGDKLYLYSHAPNRRGQSAIYRSESRDGVHWSRPRDVFDPSSSGFDAGHVSSPEIVRDPTTGEWTMWYIASGHVSGISENLLGRARSRDGVNWTERELFLKPEWLASNILHVTLPRQLRASSGDYLYLVAHHASGARTIIRLETPNPHLVTALRAAGR